MDIKTILEDQSVRIGVGVIVGFGLGYTAARHIYRNQTIVVPAEESTEDKDDIVTDEEYHEMAKQYTKVSSFEELALSDDGVVVVNNILDDESVDEAKTFIASIPDLNDDEEPVKEVVKESEPEEVVEESEFEEQDTHNIFANSDDWDYEAELASRTKTAPYVIHKDEFFSGESNLKQLTFTYYTGDDVVVDDQKIPEPIYRHDRVVGDLKFGHGSGDKNVVYIRNEDLATEYEVIKFDGKYSVEVMGLEDPDDSRNRQPLPKFRDSD